MNIIIYTKNDCVNCRVAKDILKSKGLEYEERDMGDPDDYAVFAATYPDLRQMPQIFINDQRVGGLAGLQAALKKQSVTQSH
ncbi:glutaredoxin 3 [uncultured Caudovirales phage]|uniref:Glutaredoxin 3 n=1 Tax=uncultured Caudovirales phage TaxID=2100421 RepID=A0A6J5LMD7_9CAUD|nr:glutaredoxin 3 [uncultured Caudovirales phage]CAB4134732.1 GrxC Glutaredoxin and related proteins [uncultured Caudovirales phage]